MLSQQSLKNPELSFTVPEHSAFYEVVIPVHATFQDELATNLGVEVIEKVSDLFMVDSVMHFHALCYLTPEQVRAVYALSLVVDLIQHATTYEKEFLSSVIAEDGDATVACQCTPDTVPQIENMVAEWRMNNTTTLTLTDRKQRLHNGLTLFRALNVIATDVPLIDEIAKLNGVREINAQARPRLLNK